MPIIGQWINEVYIYNGILLNIKEKQLWMYVTIIIITNKLTKRCIHKRVKIMFIQLNENAKKKNLF